MRVSLAALKCSRRSQRLHFGSDGLAVGYSRSCWTGVLPLLFIVLAEETHTVAIARFYKWWVWVSCYVSCWLADECPVYLCLIALPQLPRCLSEEILRTVTHRKLNLQRGSNVVSEKLNELHWMLVVLDISIVFYLQKSLLACLRF